MTNVLLIILNVLLIGGVLAVIGTMLVRLMRAFLIGSEAPEDKVATRD